MVSGVSLYRSTVGKTVLNSEEEYEIAETSRCYNNYSFT